MLSLNESHSVDDEAECDDDDNEFSDQQCKIHIKLQIL